MVRSNLLHCSGNSGCLTHTEITRDLSGAQLLLVRHLGFQQAGLEVPSSCQWPESLCMHTWTWARSRGRVSPTGHWGQHPVHTGGWPHALRISSCLVLRKIIGKYCFIINKDRKNTIVSGIREVWFILPRSLCSLKQPQRYDLELVAASWMSGKKKIHDLVYVPISIKYAHYTWQTRIHVFLWSLEKMHGTTKFYSLSNE